MHSSYYRTAIQDLEDIRSTLKHGDPDTVSLPGIRDRLGPIIADLQTLQSLRRPDSLKLARVEDGQVRIIIEMLLDEDQADDMLEKLWIDRA